MKSILFNRLFAAGTASFALMLCGAVAWAHHPITGKFDLNKKENLTGVITYVDWRNPHAHIFINVKGPKELVNWAIETEAPALLEMQGYSRETLRVGEMLTVRGSRARDNSRQVWAEELRFASNGTEVFPAKALVNTPLKARPTPKWPDGHPALGPLPGTADGFWTMPSKTALVEDGVNVRMDQYGLLANPIEDAAKVAPMQPWALGLYLNRQQRQLRDDPMYINCKPPGGVRQYQSPLGIQFMEDRAHQRIFVLMGSGNSNYRIIYLDGRKPVGQVGGDDDNPLYYGRSTGKWEGDTLVATTTGYNEDFWFTNGGLPHTSLLTLTERFTRADHETLRYQVEVDDAGAYTRKWSASWELKWKGGAALPSYFCQNNRP
jgi:hypothetical protein